MLRLLAPAPGCLPRLGTTSSARVSARGREYPRCRPLSLQDGVTREASLERAAWKGAWAESTPGLPGLSISPSESNAPSGRL